MYVLLLDIEVVCSFLILQTVNVFTNSGFFVHISYEHMYSSLLYKNSGVEIMN